MPVTALPARKKLLPVNRNYLEKVKRQEDALQDKETPKLKKTDVFCFAAPATDVFLDGSHDVGLACRA